MRQTANSGPLLFVFLLTACAQPSPPATTTSIFPRIEGRAPLYYAALFGLPETRPVFLRTLGDRSWSTEAPEALAEQLTPTEQQSLEASFRTWMAGLDDDKRTYLDRRIDRWITAYEQIRLCSRLSSLEDTIDAILALGTTRDVALSVLSQSRQEAEEVGAALGGSLSTAEIAEVEYAVVEHLSGFDERALIAYFRDLYQELMTNR